MSFVRRVVAAKKRKVSSSHTKVPLESLTYEKWLKAIKVTPSSLYSQWDVDETQMLTFFDANHNDLYDYDEDSGEDVRKDEDAIFDVFEHALKDKAGELIADYKRKKFPLTVYRAVCVKDVEKINFKELGTDWTDNIDSADCYNSYRAEKGSSYFTLKAVVDKTDVDWVSTLFNNLNPAFGDPEQEINLISKKKIKVVEILTPGDKWLKVGKEGTV